MNEVELGPLHFGVVGTGRLGLSTALALQRAGFEVAHVASRSADSRERASHALGVPAHEDALLACERVDCVLLCVPDDELAGLVEHLATRAADASPLRLRIVSTSAAGGLAALAPLAQAGHDVCVLHPVATFARLDGDPDAFHGAAAAVGAHDDATRTFVHALSHAFGLLPFDLDEEDWALHAAACSCASTLVSTLLGMTSELGHGIGLHESVVRGAYGKLAASAVQRFVDSGVIAEASGPVGRGDADALARQIAAVGARTPGVEEWFRSGLDAAIRRAFASGVIDVDAAHRLARAARSDDDRPASTDAED